jgi:hypothetical protein
MDRLEKLIGFDLDSYCEAAQVEAVSNRIRDALGIRIHGKVSPARCQTTITGDVRKQMDGCQ